MLDTILSWYRDPMFLRFPVYATLVSMGAFLLFAIPLTWIAAREPAWAAKYRIQARRMRPERMVWPSVRYWLVNNALLSLVVLVVWPVIRLSGVHTGPLPPPWVVALQLLAFIYADDFVFYWMHRALHYGPLYKRIHAVHHRMPTPWAITAHFMHPVEYILTGLLTTLWPTLIGAHVVTIYLWVAFRQWEAAEGHCGYSFPWNPSRLIPLYGGVEFHDFHHAKFTGNYAGFLGYVDGLFGTYSAGYLDHMAKKKQGEGRA